MRKPCLMRNVLLALLLVLISASLCAAAERRLGAVAATQASVRASNQAAANLGAGGPGSDLRAISSPRRAQTATGFPAGTLPGSGAGGDAAEVPLSRTAMSGDPLAPAIGPEMAGSKLDRISVIAAHVGYTVVRVGYSPTVMDTPYSFALMNGNRKISTLYFDHSMALVTVQ